MLRRLYADQPASFEFTAPNRAWAEAQIKKYPDGRQASAIIPLLWRAQEQEGWLTRPAIEHVATMLGMAYIRALEVATFYFMFQLQPVGSTAHVQICGTLSCMIMGAEDLISVCKNRISEHAHALSDDGRFSWEEVECLGACTNAPMAQIGKDYYEDLTPARLEAIIDEMAAGGVPVPGPQNGRYASEPLAGLTALTEFESGRAQYNGSVQPAVDIGDTIKRIDGTEVPLVTPWIEKGTRFAERAPDAGTAAQPTDKAAAEAAARADEAKVKEVPGPKGAALDKASNGAAEVAKAAKTADVADGPTNRMAPSKPVAKPRPTKTERADTPKADAAPIAAAPVTAAPPAAASVADSAGAAAEGAKPQGLSAPRGGAGDNLREIEGIGPVLEKLAHDLGIFHFDQIAAWGPAEVAWMDSNLKGFRGRVTRDKWVAQAKLIVAEGLEAFRIRAKTNDY